MSIALVDITNACKAEASQSGTFDRSVFDACMIRKGFQKTGETSYSRTTGITTETAMKIAALVPVVGGVIDSVAKTAAEVGALPAPTPTPSKSIAAGTPAPAPAPSGGPALSSNTLLLFAGAALLFLFAARR